MSGWWFLVWAGLIAIVCLVFIKLADRYRVDWLIRTYDRELEAERDADRKKALKAVVSLRSFPPPEKRQRVWTGEGSRTESDIMHHLQYGPLTRIELDALLDVTTAGIHLPKMIARGLIRKMSNTRPYRYEVVPQNGPEILH